MMYSFSDFLVNTLFCFLTCVGVPGALLVEPVAAVAVAGASAHVGIVPSVAAVAVDAAFVQAAA